MTPQQIVDLLNEAVKRDPAAMHALVCNRVPVTEALRDHPTIEVDDIGTPGHAKVGLLGILNGICRIDGVTIASKWETVPNDKKLAEGFTRDGATQQKFVGFVLLEKPWEGARG